DDLESWRIDHDSAMRCRDLEERLALFNGLVQLCLNQKQRHDSFSSPGSFDFDAHVEDIDQRTQDTFARIAVSCRMIALRIKEFESQGYEVENAGDFRALHERTDGILREAKRIAKIEGRMGFRGVKVSPEASKALRSLVDT